MSAPAQELSFRLTDSTLRDGSHAVAHQFTAAQVRTIVSALDAAGVPVIEVSHGDGLGGSSFNYGFAQCTDDELIVAAASARRNAKLAVLLLPGIGTVSELEDVAAHGVDIARIATHCTEADVGAQHIRAAKALGMEAVGFLMLAHMIPPAELLEQARLMESYGADCVYVVDSAGAMTLDDIRRRVSALKNGLSCEVGIHAHNNLSLAVANSLAALEEGANQVDGCTTGLGAGAGNCPTELLVASCDRSGIESGVDVMEIVDVAEDVVRPVQDRPQIIDRDGLLLGYAGVYGSFLLHAKRAAARYEVDTKDILLELGRRKVVGGQEDMIIDVAIELSSGKDLEAPPLRVGMFDMAPERSVPYVADYLVRAESRAEDVDPITDWWPDLELATAYEIQDEALKIRQQAGEQVVGIKLGLTSTAKQRRMGIDSPLTAWLTDAMVLPLGLPVRMDRLIHPRVEPEIAFLMGRELRGPGVTAAEAMAAVDRIYGAVEVIDSRFPDFRFLLPDVVADNASSSRYVTGPVGIGSEGFDLTLEACLVGVNGQIVDSATAIAVQGHPGEALALAANSLGKRGHSIEAGWVVLTGGMTDAVNLEPGSVISFEFSTLGTIYLGTTESDSDQDASG